MNKPELLLPVGNTEMFYAAIEGGADAIYLGLRQFNARGRALNFTNTQLLTLLEIAKKQKLKVYVTLNTAIKNNELPTLLDTLHFLQQTNVHAIIIQDWGIYHLVQKYFPKIAIHASTQMGHHNSLGANYCYEKKFKRLVLARELKLSELKEIRKKTKIELEVFIHGALCYSFSGACLFSSYLGGNSANRGLCTQPCRRCYKFGEEKKYVFSLKDNQAADMLDELKETGINSLKVEGRLKPAEFVYNVSKAYRRLIDENDLQFAKKLLALDMGREKNGYFLSGDLSKSITENTNTGILLGKVLKRTDNFVTFTSTREPKTGNRIRFKQENREAQKTIKIKEFTNLKDNTYQLEVLDNTIEIGDQVYLVGMMQKRFPSKFKENVKSVKTKFPNATKTKIIRSLLQKKLPQKEQTYVRIDSLAWLRKVHLKEVDFLILNLKKTEWKSFKWDAPFLKKNARKLIVELPKFIGEQELDFYRKVGEKAVRNSYVNFMLSHISQKKLLPPNVRIACNENVYLFNDAAIAHLHAEKINLYCHPQENELENLLQSNDRFGIVPMYFYPQLFCSRMPVKTGNHKLFDDMGGAYDKELRDGISIVYPQCPVSWTHQKNRLTEEGFRKFLIDLSHEKASSNTFNRLMKHLKQSKQIQPSNGFNFRKGLK